MDAKGFQRSELDRVTQSYPSPGVSFIHKAPNAMEISPILDPSPVNGKSSSSSRQSLGSSVLKNVHISAQLMEDFLELARDNTSNDLETCGVLGASLCQAVNEEEIFAIQSEQSLFPVGWIHTHPSQSCFMSSIDLHTQFSYQVMVPEAVAIVMAPTDKSRLSDPSGMRILRECPEKGFHTHSEPADGSCLYEHCSNVYINPQLRLEICDLR